MFKTLNIQLLLILLITSYSNIFSMPADKKFKELYDKSYKLNIMTKYGSKFFQIERYSRLTQKFKNHFLYTKTPFFKFSHHFSNDKKVYKTDTLIYYMMNTYFTEKEFNYNEKIANDYMDPFVLK